MARTGIMYSDVARAATRLVEEGKMPTVDSVRQALGSTGSKSTIGPYLKRWKAEHEGEVAAAESGLPAPLLEAVKALHQHMQAEFEQQAMALKERHAQVLQEALVAEQQMRAEHNALQSANGALNNELADTRKALSELQQQYQEQNTTLATLRTENDGLQQRLADRAAEISMLEQQLTQSRTQFDHFQEASAAQRLADRHAHEQRVSRLENELVVTQRTAATHQSMLARQEAQITQLQDELGRAAEAAKSSQIEEKELRTERDRLTERLEAVSFARDNMMAQLRAASEDLTEVRVLAASHEREARSQAERTRRLEDQVENLTHERLEWKLERAKLLHQLEQAPADVKTHQTSS